MSPPSLIQISSRDCPSLHFSLFKNYILNGISLLVTTIVIHLSYSSGRSSVYFVRSMMKTDGAGSVTRASFSLQRNGNISPAMVSCATYDFPSFLLACSFAMTTLYFRNHLKKKETYDMYYASSVKSMLLDIINCKFTVCFH